MSEQASQPKLKVLIVDDQPNMRQSFANLLYFEENLSVVGTAENGQEAVERASELKPDVIVMDIEMPVMDGLVATRQIKQAQPRIIIINVSSEARFKTEAGLAGADDFLLKPFTTEQIVEAIEQAIAKRSRA